jgi:large subunit ribosomal protein L30
MSEKLSVALVKSPIGKKANHKKIVAGLGLNKLNKVVELPDTPEIRGMIAKISHMLKVA